MTQNGKNYEKIIKLNIKKNEIIDCKKLSIERQRREKIMNKKRPDDLLGEIIFDMEYLYKYMLPV
jgi:hypothetical protein